MSSQKNRKPTAGQKGAPDKAPTITPQDKPQNAAPINSVPVPVSGSEKPLTGKAKRLVDKAAKLSNRMGAQHVAPRVRADILDRAQRGTVRYNDAPIISDDSILELDKRIRAGDKDVLARIPLAYITRPKYLPAAYKPDGTPDKRNDAWLRAKAAFNRLFVDGAKDARGVLIPGTIETDQDGRWIMSLPLTCGRLAAMVVHGDLASLLSHAGTLRSTEESAMRFLAGLEVTMPEIASVYRAASAYVKAMDALDKAESRLLSSPPEKRLAAVKSRDKIKVALYGDDKRPEQPSHVSRMIAAWHAALDIHDPTVKPSIQEEIAALVPPEQENAPLPLDQMRGVDPTTVESDMVVIVDGESDNHITAARAILETAA